jgi:type I restriction enzyme M protein
VDTFEAEADVDVNEVAKELKNLESNMKDTDKKIADYCKELNIESPF